MEYWFSITLQFIFTYLVLWWLVLFMVLPIGIRQDDDVQQGNEPGAPKDPVLKKRILWTSAITFIVSIAVVGLLRAFPFSELFPPLQ